MSNGRGFIDDVRFLIADLASRNQISRSPSGMMRELGEAVVAGVKDGIRTPVQYNLHAYEPGQWWLGTVDGTVYLDRSLRTCLASLSIEGLCVIGFTGQLNTVRIVFPNYSTYDVAIMLRYILPMLRRYIPAHVQIETSAPATCLMHDDCAAASDLGRECYRERATRRALRARPR